MFSTAMIENEQNTINPYEEEFLFDRHMLDVMTCASGSGSGTWRNPTGDDRVSSVHECGSGAKVASSTTALAHRFPPPSSSGC